MHNIRNEKAERFPVAPVYEFFDRNLENFICKRQQIAYGNDDSGKALRIEPRGYKITRFDGVATSLYTGFVETVVETYCLVSESSDIHSTVKNRVFHIILLFFYYLFVIINNNNTLRTTVKSVYGLRFVCCPRSTHDVDCCLRYK